MLRREFLVLAALTASAQLDVRAERIRRIGLLWVGGPDSSSRVDRLAEALRAHGYIVGKDVQLEKQFLVERYDRLSDAATRLARQNVDLIFCFGATACRAASNATSTIPIVIVIGSDPMKLRLAVSYAKPGKNVTGITSVGIETAGKRLQLLHEVAPRSRRIGLILSPLSQTEVAAVSNWQEAAQALALDIVRIDVASPGDIDQAIQDVPRLRVDALAVIGSTMLMANRERLVRAVNKLRLPAIYAGSPYVDSGGLLSYSSVPIDSMIPSAAGYIDKIFKGADPSAIPIEQVGRYELVVNLRTAKEQGISVPEEIIQRADRVLR